MSNEGYESNKQITNMIGEEATLLDAALWDTQYEACIKIVTKYIQFVSTVHIL